MNKFLIIIAFPFMILGAAFAITAYAFVAVANFISRDQIRASASLKFGAIILIWIGLYACAKDNCQPPEITGIIGNVAHYSPAGDYLIEQEGMDNPYNGTVKVSGTSYKLEGERYRIRIRSSCSDWSEWFYKNQ